jgi:hypothetical protein
VTAPAARLSGLGYECGLPTAKPRLMDLDEADCACRIGLFTGTLGFRRGEVSR